MPEETPPQEGQRARLFLAGGLAAILLIVVVVVVILSSGGEEREFDPASADCIAAWNDDPRAVSLGRHQLVGHGYFYVEVTTLSKDGATELESGDPAGACAMVFAASTFARERSSVAMLNKPPAGWIPLNRFQSPDRLAELQDEAQSTYNAYLEDDGTITSL
jgi:hypothetical protein